MKFFLAVLFVAAVQAEAEAEADPALLYGAYGYGGYGLGYAGLGYGYGLGLGYAGLHGLGYAGLPVLPAATVVAEEKAADEEAVAEVKTVAAPLAIAPYAYGYAGLGAYPGLHYYGKRSADAEAEADPALLYSTAYGGYGLGYAGLGYAGLGYAGLGYAGLRYGYAGYPYYG